MNNTSVTRKQAEAVRTAIMTKFASYTTEFQRGANGRYDYDLPLVQADESELPQIVENYGDYALAIVWESNSPAYWTEADLESTDVDVEATSLAQEFAPGAVIRHHAAKLPAGVLVEAIDSVAVGLFPA